VRLEQERRVHNLELRLQELSETIGTYDRLRQHDQEELSKLRDVTSATVTSSSFVTVPETAQELAEEYYRIKAKLKKANKENTSMKKVRVEFG